MILQTVLFFAVILTALALVPAGAHLFELPNKTGLSQEQYFTVQGIYRGWALFGFVLLGAIGASLVHAILIRVASYWLGIWRDRGVGLPSSSAVNRGLLSQHRLPAQQE